MSQLLNYGCLVGREPILYIKKKLPAKEYVQIKMQFNLADNFHKAYASVVAIN